MKKKYDHLIWIGAGSAAEPADIIQSAEYATLVDARRESCVQLRKKFPQNNVKIEQLIITPDSKEAAFTEYNLPEYSSIKKISGLKTLFPGLRVVTSDNQKVTDIKKFIKQIASYDNNALVIDLLDVGLDLLKALLSEALLDSFRNIKIHTAIEPAYVKSATTVETTDFLQKNGYILTAHGGSDPELPWLTFEINPLWSRLQKEVAQQESLLTEIKIATDRQSTIQIELDENKSQLTSLQEEYETIKYLLVSSQNELKLKSSELTATSKQLEETENKLKIIQIKLEKNLNNESREAANSLEKSHAQLLDKIQKTQNQEISKAVATIKNNIKNSLNNTAKQLEAFISIQSYLEHGIKPLDFHGWPISPDVGLYIAGLIDKNNYDIIIEFGSGTSTVLMAKAILTKQRNSGLKNISTQSNENLKTLKDTSESDLPTRIVTFEHHKNYYEKTLQALKDNGATHLVDLVHTPLVDYKYLNDDDYLYYNCADKLQEISNIYGSKKAKILVLVDGPPGATNKHARFPAIPHLINILPGHEYTIIMDDYNRPEEREIVDLWRNILTKRGLAPTLEEIQSEKGFAILSIN